MGGSVMQYQFLQLIDFAFSDVFDIVYYYVLFRSSLLDCKLLVKMTFIKHSIQNETVNYWYYTIAKEKWHMHLQWTKIWIRYVKYRLIIDVYANKLKKKIKVIIRKKFRLISIFVNLSYKIYYLLRYLFSF